jgi:hypothetical protein
LSVKILFHKEIFTIIFNIGHENELHYHYIFTIRGIVFPFFFFGISL